MKRLLGTLCMSLGLMLSIHSAASSQAFGFGIGLVGLTSNMQQAGGQLQDQFASGKYSYSDISDLVGVALKVKGKFPIGAVRIIASGGYDFFPTSQVTIVSLDQSQGTFDVGTSMIPITAGIEFAIGSGPMHPFLSAEPSLTFINRTYTSVANTGNFNGVSFNNVKSDDSEIGLSLGAGLEFGAFGTWMNVTGQYHLVNLLSSEESETSMGYAEVGVSIFMGDLGN